MRYGSLFLSFLIFFASSLLISFPSCANTLDDLLKKVIKERSFQIEEFQKREERFRKEKDKRKLLLTQAVSELQKEEKITNRLTKEFEKNEKELTILETELNLAVGVLGELFGVVKQVAGDLKGNILSSLVSAEISGREKWLKSLTQRKSLPTTSELRKLWFEMQREMTELGKVTKFSAPVISLDGKTSTQSVIRVGGFNLVSRGRYLGYEEIEESGQRQILELIHQPKRQFTKTIRNLEKPSKDTYPVFALDPSRGTLMSILIRVPNVWEKIQQGGLVGFVIICLLIFGFALVIERWLVLRKEQFKIFSQLKDSSNPKVDNPIGEILILHQHNKHLDLESLELKLSEVVIRYLPRLERGIGTIKILAVLSPLLGLLGTVTGMILTFQSITLFGAGDPKIMAGGISQALVTTVLGLCCAIPLLLCHNFISARARDITQVLEEQTAGLLAKRLEKK